MNDEIRTNVRKIKEGWWLWKMECRRIISRFFTSIVSKEQKFRPLHDWHGLVTATIELPYRTWGLIFEIWLVLFLVSEVIQYIETSLI